MTTSNQHAASTPESPAQQLDRTWREMQGKLRRRARSVSSVHLERMISVVLAISSGVGSVPGLVLPRLP